MNFHPAPHYSVLCTELVAEGAGTAPAQPCRILYNAFTNEQSHSKGEHSMQDTLVTNSNPQNREAHGHGGTAGEDVCWHHHSPALCGGCGGSIHISHSCRSYLLRHTVMAEARFPQPGTCTTSACSGIGVCRACPFISVAMY